MKRLLVTGHVLLPDAGFGPGTVHIMDGTIERITPGIEAGADLVAPSGGCIIPGLIDLQVNGAFGADFTVDPAAVCRVAAALPSTGVTAFLPTIITSPFDGYPAALRTISEAATEAKGARILGIHLEGPYLNPRRHGAHDLALLRSIDVDEILGWADPSIVRIVTIAPELPGALQAVAALRARGIVVSAGHSDATLEEARAGFGAGITWGTHLFNAMSPLAHREPGLAGALLTAPFPCGLIVDGEHVHPAVVAIAVRARARAGLTLVTDSMSAMGMPPGRYRLSNRDVIVDGTTARLADGTLAGSVLALDAAIRNAIAFAGCSLEDAVTMATATPAAVLGLARFGRIAPGCAADLVLLDESAHVAETIIGGELVYDRATQDDRAWGRAT
ncbi:MAG TPA: N-acetylglucosamine-6-phosphate deacetylase [Anaerolineae bacterium]